MTVNQMVNYLDREEIPLRGNAGCGGDYGNCPPKLRKFCLALKRVMVDEMGPEIYIRKKMCSALKISVATYYLTLEKLEKMLP